MKMDKKLTYWLASIIGGVVLAKGGKIGEATVMDTVDEQVFCLNTFGDDVTAALVKSGDLQAL